MPYLIIGYTVAVMAVGMLIDRYVSQHRGRVGKHARSRLNTTGVRPTCGVDAQWAVDLNAMRRDLIADPRCTLTYPAATGDMHEGLLSGDELELLAGYQESVSSHG
jgi:hypothetical protein